MKRLLVLGCAVLAVVLVLRKPAPPPAIASIASPVRQTRVSQNTRKGHPFVASSAAVIYVVGAVARPGLYRVRAGARVNDVIERAGGLRSDADPAAVNLAERVTDGEEIHVLRMGETARATTRRTRRKAPSPAPLQPIDLNAADESALALIPGIGPTLASRIVAYRRLNGPFESLDELADVAGITQRRIDAMAAYVLVNTSR